MAKKKRTAEDIEQIRRFADRISDDCKCVKNGKASPKCKVCDGTGKPKLRPLR